MKVLFLFPFLVCIVFFSPLSHIKAQDTTSVHIIPPGSKAIQFGINSFFRLTSFSGATFSYKKHSTSKRAKRISFHLNNLYRNANHIQEELEQKENIINLEFGLEHTWMNYLNQNFEVKFYYGLGPGADFAYNFRENENIISTSERKEVRFGLYGIGYSGFEWFFKPQISLHAEYRAVIRVEHTRETRRIIDERLNRDDNGYSTGIILRGEPLLFGLSVYF